MAVSTTTEGNSDRSATAIAPTFDPTNCTTSTPMIKLPEELWLTILENPCTFPPTIFSEVMLNLIKNPNITSSYLFRADIYYDSENDYTLERCSNGQIQSRLLKQMKLDYQPLQFALDGYEVTRTIVRKLVPRNPQLDDALVQTCHFLSRIHAQEETTIVLYIPHIRNPERMPFYHPSVSRIAFFHRWQASGTSSSYSDVGLGSISISYGLFPDTGLTIKLERTAHRLLQTIHKHGQGQLTGYEKRVHLDQIIPQKRYQDTYTRLKAKYGKNLAEQWVEVTDPGKHVFEDISIAAFLIELWRDMYSEPQTAASDQIGRDDAMSTNGSKPRFPGFVDIGCGNGVLVYLLLAEGYEGWGFDARERKTWSIFPETIKQRLRRRILLPEVLRDAVTVPAEEIWHNGIFETGTFIISNHADELTAWTPLLAYLNQSSFVAIPCCSHDFTGARFRAPPSVKTAINGPVRLPQQSASEHENSVEVVSDLYKSQAAETGSLRRSVVQKKMQSAYSTLCSYVTSLADEVGYKPEKEVLRIPSTRNQCIIGRYRNNERGADIDADREKRKQVVVDIVQRELKISIDVAAAAWIGKVENLASKPGSGH